MKEKIMKALKKNAIDPETGIDVVTMKMVKSVAVDKAGNAVIKFKPTTPFCPMIGYLQEIITQSAKTVKGVKSVKVECVM
jgi:metal-sulfur cluster biosynthetic enzyme